MTEKEVENLLELETRYLDMPPAGIKPLNGQPRAITMSRYNWDSYAFLQGCGMTAEEIAIIVAWDAPLDGYEFNEYFSIAVSNMAYLICQTSKKLGFR
ncbi:MAG: hypothetical protein L3K26_00015 [Candidatus Hydrogenedentes bacterium]|nr:hypothetical protein [Candidatus Hydrogenedentota bacterium]